MYYYRYHLILVVELSILFYLYYHFSPIFTYPLNHSLNSLLGSNDKSSNDIIEYFDQLYQRNRISSLICYLVTVGDLKIIIPSEIQNSQDNSFFYLSFILNDTQDENDDLVNLLNQINNSLRVEENRNNYVSKEIKQLLSIKDEIYQTYPQINQDLMEYLVQQQLSKSSLASFIKKLFYHINNSNNNNIDSIYLNTTIILNSSSLCFTILSQLQLYHSLYFIKPKSKVIKELESKHYGDLVELINHINSNLTLQNICYLLHISRNQILNYSSYLILKGYMKYGHPMNSCNASYFSHFRINTNVLNNKNSEIQFRKEFPSISISFNDLLSCYKCEIPLEIIEKIDKINNISILTEWLLSHNCLRQLHPIGYYIEEISIPIVSKPGTPDRIDLFSLTQPENTTTPLSSVNSNRKDRTYYYNLLIEYLQHKNDMCEYLFEIPECDIPEFDKMIEDHENEFLITYVEYDDEFAV